jgi:5-methyltetrahydrofolate--homocysteine methyltransferase
VLENLKVIYKETPGEMVRELPGLLEAGARIVGGCCGSTPEHIAAFREAVDRFPPA